MSDMKTDNRENEEEKRKKRPLPSHSRFLAGKAIRKAMPRKTEGERRYQEIPDFPLIPRAPKRQRQSEQSEDFFSVERELVKIFSTFLPSLSVGEYYNCHTFSPLLQEKGRGAKKKKRPRRRKHELSQIPSGRNGNKKEKKRRTFVTAPLQKSDVVVS